jgi:HD-like signal output (HDOD) protein
VDSPEYMPPPTDDERRRFTRFSQRGGLEVFVVFESDRDGIDISSLGSRRGILVDLSTGGALVHMDRIGDLVGAWVRLCMDGSENESALEIRSQVVRTQQISNQHSALALSFGTEERWGDGMGQSERVAEIEELTTYLLDNHSLVEIPGVIEGILRVATAPRATSADLSKFIAEDPALENKVLRVARSPLFMTRTGVVSTLPDAVKLLGYQAVANIAISLAATQLFRKVDGSGSQALGFWEHSLACANFADLIHTSLGGNEGELFAAGFLHDLGKLLLVYTFEAEYRQMSELLRAGQRRTRNLEQDVLGMAHDQVNRLLVKRLGLVGDIAAAMVEHHGTGTEWSRPAAVVHVADHLCFDFQVIFPSHAIRPDLNEWALRSLGLDLAQMAELRTKANGVVQNLQLWNQILPRAPQP